jgi:hypothetical protein
MRDAGCGMQDAGCGMRDTRGAARMGWPSSATHRLHSGDGFPLFGEPSLRSCLNFATQNGTVPSGAGGFAPRFCPTEIFFFFLVGRNSVNFAPARPRKSFAARRLVRGGGAKLPRFRPGGGAKSSPGGALFVGPEERQAHTMIRCAKLSPPIFAHL